VCILMCDLHESPLRLFAMREPFFLELSGVSIHRSNLLKLGVEIYSYQ